MTMTVLCKKTCCNESVLLLPMRVDDSVGDDNFALLMGYTVDSEITEYHITEGTEYIVYGILVYKNQVRYLIQDNDSMPVFCPNELFCIEKSNVYWDWGIESFLVDGMPLLIIGYPAMEGSYEMLIELVKRKKDAIEKFLTYKEYTKKYCNIL